MHRLHRRAAEAVHGHAAHLVGQPGEQADDTCEVATLRRFGVGAAENQVFEKARGEVGARQQAAHDLGGDRVGAHTGQRALLCEVEG